MSMTSIAIADFRNMPSKFGEFYPATGEMDPLREIFGQMGFRAAMLIAIRDLGIYLSDITDVKSCFQNTVLDRLCENVMDMILYYSEYYKAIYCYDKETPEEKTEMLKNDILGLEIGTPMNPVEEFAGMIYYLSRTSTYGLEQSQRTIVEKAYRDVEELDKINDRFWSIIDKLEKR